METQATQILSLEAALQARPPLPPDAPEDEKDKLIVEQAKTIRELEFVVKGYEDNLGEPLRAVREDVESQWIAKVEHEVKLREEKEAWANELVRQLEKEKQVRRIDASDFGLANVYLVAIDTGEVRGRAAGACCVCEEVRLVRSRRGHDTTSD